METLRRTTNACSSTQRRQMLQDLYSIKGKGSWPLSKEHTISQGFVPVQKCKRLDAKCRKNPTSNAILFGPYSVNIQHPVRRVNDL